MEVSLMESILDFQAEALTAYLNGGKYESASGGIYRTDDGYIAIAAEAALIPPSQELRQRKTEEWAADLAREGIACEPVLTWEQLFRQEGFQSLDMLQEIQRTNGRCMMTTRCPVRIDGQLLKSGKGSPAIGEDNGRIAAAMAR